MVKRLRDFYDAWWTELEPTFAQDCAIYLGHADENPAVLTCHDWITTGTTPWNQRSVRAAMTGEKNTGFWNVNVVADGQYEIRLRRWPAEADAAIDAGLPAGADVPGDKAFRAHPGKAVPAGIWQKGSDSDKTVTYLRDGRTIIDCQYDDGNEFILTCGMPQHHQLIRDGAPLLKLQTWDLIAKQTNMLLPGWSQVAETVYNMFEIQPQTT